jgi:hypothetical protein
LGRTGGGEVKILAVGLSVDWPVWRAFVRSSSAICDGRAPLLAIQAAPAFVGVRQLERQSLAYVTLISQQMGGRFLMIFGVGAIDAVHGDRVRAIFCLSYPALFFQIPEMKFQMLGRAA